MTLISGSSFGALFDTVTRSARRLETRDRYANDQVWLNRWLAREIEELPITGALTAWPNRVRATTSAGGVYQRVRFIREPPTDNQRFLLMAAQQNVEAGEDIRYLRQDHANTLDLPAHDFWLFDEQRLALMYFTADDRLLGAQLITEHHIVGQHAGWLDTAWVHATPYPDYLSDDPTRARRPS